MVNTRLFTGQEESLVVYNQQAIIDQTFYFYTRECEDFGFENIDFDFTGYQSAFFRIFNERLGRQIKDLPLTQNGPYLYLNASILDMTLEDNGWYYYEIGYVQSGGYEQVLRFGTLKVI